MNNANNDFFIELVLIVTKNDLPLWLDTLNMDARFKLCIHDHSNAGSTFHNSLATFISSIAEKKSCEWCIVPKSENNNFPTVCLSHIIANYDKYSENLKHTRPTITPECTSLVLFLTDQLSETMVAFGVNQENIFIQMLLQDAILNGCSKSFTTEINLVDNDNIFSQWFQDYIQPYKPSKLFGWRSDHFAVQIDTLIQRPNIEYKRLMDALDERKIMWLKAAWFYLLDKAPIDYTLIPFYGSQNGDDDIKTLEMLELTIFNACKVTRKKVLIGVGSNTHQDLVQKMYSSRNPFVTPFRTPDLPDTKSHGVLFCSCIQQQQYADDDIIYFADGNAILCGNNIHNHILYMRECKNGTYLSPHRFQYRTNTDPSDNMDGRFTQTIFDQYYVLSNSTAFKDYSENLTNMQTIQYRDISDVKDAYAGAYIIPFKAFRAILFTIHHTMPRESTSFSPFYHYGFQCVKTESINDLYVLTFKDRRDFKLPPIYHSLKF